MEYNYDQLLGPVIWTQSIDLLNTGHYIAHEVSPPLQSLNHPELLPRKGSSVESSKESSAAGSPSSPQYALSMMSPSRTSPDMHCGSDCTSPTTACYGTPDCETEQDAAYPSGMPKDGRRKNPQSRRDSPVCCLHPGCTARPFKRRADLDQHYRHRHAPSSLKEAYSCDYPRCSRHIDPFNRLDHFRDHLREFHKEDTEKRGDSPGEDWFGDRQLSSNWWRCSKCLARVCVDRSGYECPDCKTRCQAKRKEARRRRG